MALDSTFFSEMMTFMDENMGAEMINKASNLISSLAPIFSTLFGIYMLFIAISYWNGVGIAESFTDFMKRCIVWCFLIFCAFNASQYGHIADLIYGLPDDLANVFSGYNYAPNALDNQYNKVNAVLEPLEIKLGKFEFYQMGDIVRYSVVIWSIRVLCALVIGVSFAFYLVAKCCLALTLMVGPIFLAMSLFPVTRQYAMNWISQCFNYVITILLLTIVASLQIKFFENAMNTLQPHEDITLAIAFVVMLMFMTVVYIILIWNVPNIASALTGGAAVNTGSRELGRLVGNAASMVGAHRQGKRDKDKDKDKNKNSNGSNLNKLNRS